MIEITRRACLLSNYNILHQPPDNMSFDHCTIVDGRGYRFTLPRLGLPDPQGEWVLIEGATSAANLEMVKVPPTPANSTMRFPFGDCKTISVRHDGATWELPLLEAKGEVDPFFFKVRVRRVLATGEEAQEKDEPTTQPTTSSTDVSHKSAAGVDSVASTLAATTLGASKTSSTKKAKTSRTPPKASISGSSGRKASTPSKTENPCTSASSAHLTPATEPTIQPPPGAPQPKPACANGLCVDCTKHMGAARGNYRLDTLYDWKMNEILKHRLCWTKYVDVLPKGDCLPPEITSHPSYKKQKGIWAVDLQQRTFYLLNSTPPDVRATAWLALTMPHVGLPCVIANNVLGVDLAQPRGFYMPILGGAQLADGPALLKVVPISPSRYACQPTAASTETSFFLNRFKLLVEQPGRQYAAEPLGRPVHVAEDAVLSMLGQWAMAEGGAAGDKMAFCSVPGPLPGLDELHNVGIRLRDGGARLRIISKSKDRKRIKLPGTVFFHALFGDEESLDKMGDKKMAKPDAQKTKEVSLRSSSIPPGPQDLLLRVVDEPQGLFRELQYLFRQRGSFLPVKESEWKAMEAPMLDEWVVKYFLNIARQSFGRLQDRA